MTCRSPSFLSGCSNVFRVRDFLIGLAVGVLIAIGLSGKAETWMVVNGLAQHLDHNSYCNNHITKGFGIEHSGWSLGIYDNSNCNLSAYVAKSWLPLAVGSVRIGAIAGAVSGYANVPLPAAGLVATYERERWGTNLVFIPPFADSSPGVLWLQLKFRWR